MKVEYLLADEDGTWRTEIIDVPEEELTKRSDAGDDDWTLQAWAREHLTTQAQYRRIVLFAVYSIPDEGGL